MSELWRKFFLTDPWEGFEPDEEDDTSGWHNDMPVFAIAVQDAKLIIEVGSWKGSSAITMLKHAPEATVICVDTWLGGLEHWDMPDDPTNPNKGWTYHMIKWKHGRPTLYQTFMSNIKKAGMEKRVIPISLTSRIASKLIKKTGLLADAIYIDGSHEYDDVLDDLKNYWELLKPGGVMFGDDYAWVSVIRAVDEFVEENNLKLELFHDSHWYLAKDSHG